MVIDIGVVIATEDMLELLKRNMILIFLIDYLEKVTCVVAGDTRINCDKELPERSLIKTPSMVFIEVIEDFVKVKVMSLNKLLDCAENLL